MIKEYLKLFRVPQWIKNLFVFVPLLFSQNLLNFKYFLVVFFAFFVFSFTSSIVYILNDIVDIEADNAHPQKKLRPLASGKISIKKAKVSVIVFSIFVLSSFLFFNYYFIGAVTAYFLLNIFYTYSLKHIVLLDIFSIAAGFMLRVFAGAFAINVEVSSWLILTTMFISLFLAVMKRRSELRLTDADDTASTRKVLTHYSRNFTDQMATVAAAGVIISYALYTVSIRTVTVFKTENLIYTTPFVVFGIFRYMYLVYMNKQGENTSEILISDLPMILNVLLYILTITLIIYT